MAKDVNIHIRTPGAQQAKQELDKLGKSAQQVGDKTAAGQKRGADETGKTTQKMSGMGRVLGSLKTAVLGFVGAYLGLQGVQKIITWLIQKLERIAQLQKDIYEKSLSFMEIGQALEMQTGTAGKQQFWAQQAAGLQAAGGLAAPGVAQQMMISADIAFQKQGGIKNQQVLSMLTQLAPFVGAQQLGPGEVAKLFEFAGTAGIAPTPEAYKKFFAQLQAGYTASKATIFGQYLLGLQKGGTPYMAMGGTLEETISAFVGARSVMPTEELAGSMLEQIARLSGGAYERPRKIMERELGVSWEAMSMDERLNTLLRYVGGIPEARRQQVLAAQGFPVELTTKVGMMVSPEAMKARRAAGQAIGIAGAPQIDQLTKDYLQSVLGKERITEAEIGLKKLVAAPEFAGWQTRLSKAEAQAKILAAEGRPREAFHPYAQYIIALEQLEKEAGEFLEALPEGPRRERAGQLISDIRYSIGLITEDPLWAKFGIVGPRAGLRYTQEFERIVEVHYHNDINHYPRQGSDERGPRTPANIK